MESRTYISGNSSNKPLCRYFASNICNRGSTCPYSHDRNARPNMTCTYYLAGSCSYGTACRYNHIRPRVGTPSTSKVSRNKTSPTPAASNTYQEHSDEVETSTTNAWSRPLSYIAPRPDVPLTMNSLFGELERIEAEESGNDFTNRRRMPASPADIQLCPYNEVGCCMLGDGCSFIHGDTCDMCGVNCLHPFNEVQRLEHHRACLSDHEAAMEAAFAEARSLDKQCGICMEVIVEKQLRFGILENCKHCYCLDCIRKWRQRSEEFAHKIVRSCPECRVMSDFVIPSTVWVEDGVEKERLIGSYRENMKQKECKYTRSGTIDDCPFGNKCFYRHLRSDGTSVEGESPRELRKRRRLIADLQHELFDDEDEEDLILNEVINSITSTRRSRRRSNRN